MKSLFKTLNDRLFSSAYQVRRIIILVAILIVAGTVSFGTYYYFDRFAKTQPLVSEKSIADAEQAVRDNPGDPNVRLGLAETYLLYSRFDDAISQALQVEKEYPDDVRVDFILGISYANNGSPEKALEPLQKFIDSRKDEENPGLDKQLQAASYYLGESYMQLDQPEKAILPYENAVNWSQTDADAMYKLGRAYAGVDDYNKAVNMYIAATTFVPNYYEAYEDMAAAYDILKEPDLATYARGMMAYSKEDYRSALDLLLKSAEAKPDFPLTFAGIGRTYEALKDLPNAKIAYETALKLDPNNFTASTGILRVEAGMKK
ncbi:MAG: tetratricopeptide repeat protein [Chloroflexi bacterium]|nr:tetratricopeptide repeat protein [Chloroflexota bacterium]